MSKHRTRNATTVLTPSEYEALREMAYRERKTLSTLLRDILLEKTDMARRASFFEQTGRDVVHDGIDGVSGREGAPRL